MRVRRRWRWRKPPMWLRLRRRKIRRREDRLITIMGDVYDSPDPGFADKWEQTRASLRSSEGREF